MTAIRSFARWHWNRVKEFPLVLASFTAGCITEAVFLTFPQLAYSILAGL